MPFGGIYHRVMSMTYAQMVEGCRRRDAKAQRALYDATAPMAMGVCMRYAASRAEAQDMMQDGYIAVFEKIATVREPEKVGAWIYTVMVNTCVSHCRRQRHEAVVDDMEPLAGSFDFDPCAKQDLVAAMQQLSPRQRTVFNLFTIEGYSLNEVAEMLKCSNVSVRVMLNRSRNIMKEFLTNKR